MKKVLVGGVLPASEISLGCFRLHTADKARAAALVGAALEEGIDFFDNADIYGGGRCEEMFAEAIGMCPDVREKILIQTKCGIRPGRYDFSREHILKSVEGSLRRLKTEYIDVLLLHRPDTLMEPDEVAEAFDRLHSSDKVRYFGVSNFTPLQMELLKKAAQVFAPAGFDMEIVEKHHNQKLDAPSGTALALADSMNEALDEAYTYTYDRSQKRKKRDKYEIGLSSVRGGNIVGEHEVIFAGQDEVIEFKHTAYSKAVFAKGAVEAAKFLKGKPAGHYDMADVIAAK